MLFPTPAKCLERIVHSAIYDHVLPFLTEWQHGFIKGRSCETQLILTHHQWATALDKGRQVDVVFLAELSRAKRTSGAPWVRKFGKLSIQ